MHLYIIPEGTKVCLGNGNGVLKVFITEKEFSTSEFISDPIYYHNNKSNPEIMRELNSDTTVREKGRVVAKYSMAELTESENPPYKFVYVNFNDVITY